ncbi:MAG: efflux RND transporter permease subunit, partial [Armatimonadota bacterium]|nr:efflux RND transporter permease subunit [Armatimonadota bacterium]
RLRPILMTTLSLVLAMIPIALAVGRGSEFRAPLGIVIIGGLTVSTLLTLIVIPCMYTVMDDLTRFLGRIIWGRRAVPVEQAAVREREEEEARL